MNGRRNRRVLRRINHIIEVIISGARLSYALLKLDLLRLDFGLLFELLILRLALGKLPLHDGVKEFLGLVLRRLFLGRRNGSWRLPTKPRDKFRQLLNLSPLRFNDALLALSASPMARGAVAIDFGRRILGLRLFGVLVAVLDIFTILGLSLGPGRFRLRGCRVRWGLLLGEGLRLLGFRRLARVLLGLLLVEV